MFTLEALIYGILIWTTLIFVALICVDFVDMHKIGAAIFSMSAIWETPKNDLQHIFFGKIGTLKEDSGGTHSKDTYR